MTGLAIVFGFMVFLIILNKGHVHFFSGFSFIVVAAISLGIGFGVAAVVNAVFESMSVVLPVLVVIIIIGVIFARK